MQEADEGVLVSPLGAKPIFLWSSLTRALPVSQMSSSCKRRTLVMWRAPKQFPVSSHYHCNIWPDNHKAATTPKIATDNASLISVGKIHLTILNTCKPFAQGLPWIQLRNSGRCISINAWYHYQNWENFVQFQEIMRNARTFKMPCNVEESCPPGLDRSSIPFPVELVWDVHKQDTKMMANILFVSPASEDFVCFISETWDAQMQWNNNCIEPGLMLLPARTSTD